MQGGKEFSSASVDQFHLEKERASERDRDRERERERERERDGSKD
jgi:hypothetical protein